MKKQVFVVLTLFLLSITANAQQSMFKALFMFNFAKYIQWPNHSAKSDFVIAVYGDDDITKELSKLAAARKINNKTLVVKSIKSLDEANNAQILFIPTGKSSNLDGILSHFKNKSTLIITDKEGLCAKGSQINYVNIDGKLKFEISKNNIAAHNLNLDPKLLSLGIEIN